MVMNAYSHSAAVYLKCPVSCYICSSYCHIASPAKQHRTTLEAPHQRILSEAVACVAVWLQS